MCPRPPHQDIKSYNTQHNNITTQNAGKLQTSKLKKLKHSDSMFMLIPNDKYQTNYLQNFTYDAQTGKKTRPRHCIRQPAVWLVDKPKTETRWRQFLNTWYRICSLWNEMTAIIESAVVGWTSESSGWWSSYSGIAKIMLFVSVTAIVIRRFFDLTKICTQGFQRKISAEFVNRWTKPLYSFQSGGHFTILIERYVLERLYYHTKQKLVETCTV